MPRLPVTEDPAPLSPMSRLLAVTHVSGPNLPDQIWWGTALQKSVLHPDPSPRFQPGGSRSSAPRFCISLGAGDREPTGARAPVSTRGGVGVLCALKAVQSFVPTLFPTTIPIGGGQSWGDPGGNCWGEFLRIALKGNVKGSPPQAP